MSDLTDLFYPLGNPSQSLLEDAGAAPKISRLSWLSGQGFNVPKGWVIPAAAAERLARQGTEPAGDLPGRELARRLFLSPFAMDSFRRLWELAGPRAPLILRSAVDLEDQAHASFAGIFRSIKPIREPDELVLAFAECWSAVHSASAAHYADRRAGGKPLRLSLLLQEYIEGDLSGVTFTVDPLAPVGHQFRIEAGPGDCEGVTSGTARVSSWRYDWSAERLDPIGGQSEGIDREHLAGLARQCLDIQRLFGTPQDIEWTIKNGQAYILQSRPVTGIRLHDRYIWTNANFRDGGIGAQMPSPLMWSLYSFTFESAIERFTRATSLVPDDKPERWTRTFFGYPYWNLTSTKASSQKVLGYVERQFDAGQGVDPYYEGDGYVTRFSPFSLVTSLRALWAITRSIRGRFRRCAEARDYFQQVVLRRFGSTPLDELPADALADYLRQLIEADLRFLYGRYWEIIYDNTFLNTFLQNHLSRYNRRKKLDLDFAQVVSGIEDIAHIRPLQALWDLRGRILKDPPARQFWQDQQPEEIARLYLAGGPLPCREAFGAIITRFGYKSGHELEIAVPNWQEDPAPAVRLLQSLLREDAESPLARLQGQQGQYRRCRSLITSRSLLKKIDQERKLLWWKEEMRDLTTHLFHLIRQVVCRLEQALRSEGRLEEQGDAFFLPFSGLLALAGGTDEAAQRETIRYNRIIRESFRHFAKPNLIFPETTPVHTAEEGSRLQGIGVSPGVVRGRALLVADPADAPEPLSIRDGQVLVTSFFNPSHLHLFNQTKAIVTANGGMLSHGAIICREFGIPAVFGISGILGSLRPGDWIEIDGQAGTVKILSHAPETTSAG